VPARKRLKIIFYLNLAILGLLIFYKIYLNFFEQDFESVHPVQVERIQSLLDGEEQFRFAVVGNINNSIGIFERKIIPMLNRANVDFVVSAGNAVSAGGEDKYRALERTLSRLEMPYVLTFGRNEAGNFGAFRYYKHFGPYFFSFAAGNSRFIFLDTTGTTSYSWQLHWLKEELAATGSEPVFLFMSHPFEHVPKNPLLVRDDDYLDAPEFRDALVSLADNHDVDGVFSANLPYFHHEQRNGVDYYVTGGAGGLVLNNEDSFYHFLEVTVSGDTAGVVMNRLEIGQHPAFKTLESFWFFIHSLFYVGYLNFLLIISALLLVAIKLYTLIFVERDYYRRFDVDPDPFLDRPLRVAMFTNNYLPFIGGVPISIDRLRRGLQALGDSVLILAPRYRHHGEHEPGVVRVPALLSFGEKREFRMVNVFHGLPRRETRRFRPDIVHIHHPIWMGDLGVFMARRLRIPAMFTYHTRLEHYAHFVPLPGPLFRNLISHWLIRRLANKCDGVIVPTYSTEDYLRVIGVKTQIFVQPTGIDIECIRNIDPERVRQLREQLAIGHEKVLVSVSRISREKNVDFILDALHVLKRKSHVPFRLLMLGDGDERQRIRQRAKEEGLEDIVSLPGAIPPDDVPVWLKLADVFVFASKSETQGMVILEAMAAGLPVVAVRSSGIDDVITNGVNGFKTGENPEQWASSVADLLRDDALRKKMAASALDFGSRHGVQQFASGVRAAYAHCIAARQPAKVAGQVARKRIA